MSAMASRFASRASRYHLHSHLTTLRPFTPPRPRQCCKIITLPKPREFHRHLSTTSRLWHEASRNHKSSTQADDLQQTNFSDALLNSLANQSTQTYQNISLRPLYVAVGICVGSFIIADYLDRMADADFVDILKKSRSDSTSDLHSANQQVQRYKLDRSLAFLEQLHAPLVISQLGSTVLRWWHYKDDAQSASIIIIAANLAVFLAWRTNSSWVMRRMVNSFMHYPGRTPSYTLLTSVFSHQSFMHLAFNMLALYGFANASFSYLKYRRMNDYPNRDESGQSMNITSRYHFVAIFMTFGVIANLIPHYLTLHAARSPAMMRSFLAPALTPTYGLGASGAVYSTMAVSALSHPEIEVSIIFLPFLPFKLGYGFPAICAIDAVGVLRGWRRFGHLVHLTGAAAGAGAFAYGPAVWYWGQSALRGGKIRSSD